MAILATNLSLPKFRYTVTATDANGNSYLAPAVGYKLYAYEAGTTTDLTVYQDAALTTPHPQPIVLDSDGSATVYYNQEAKFDLLTDQDAAVDGFPVDNVQPISDSGTVTLSEWIESGSTGTQASATTFTVTGDQTAVFTVNRRVRILDGSYRYGRVTGTSVSGNTTVTVEMDSAYALTSGMDGNAVYVGLLQGSNRSVVNIGDVFDSSGTKQLEVSASGVELDPTDSNQVTKKSVPVYGTVILDTQETLHTITTATSGSSAASGTLVTAEAKIAILHIDLEVYDTSASASDTYSMNVIISNPTTGTGHSFNVQANGATSDADYDNTSATIFVNLDSSYQFNYQTQFVGTGSGGGSCVIKLMGYMV